jgi:hypothetical protein
MARGWESKSVEEQQSEFGKGSARQAKAQQSPEDKKRSQRLETLQLARANVLRQLETSQNERHKALLQQELDQLNIELSALGS